jgi:hypothetical protein
MAVISAQSTCTAKNGTQKAFLEGFVALALTETLYFLGHRAVSYRISSPVESCPGGRKQLTRGYSIILGT